MEISTVRVVVVDDFEPFRRLIYSMLRKDPRLRSVGEASDGLEGVRKAEELQPDLVLLDIGLPGINGIEAARRIRKVSPRSKILFVSQESSADVVQEALATGALGYVVKAFAANELFPAIEEVLAGRRFISSSSSLHRSTLALRSHSPVTVEVDGAPPKLHPENGNGSHHHKVEFFPSDEAFVDGLGSFIRSALEGGKAILVVATASHLESIQEVLQNDDLDIVAAAARGRYLAFDVDEVLSSFMTNDLLDEERFFQIVGDMVVTAARTTEGKASRVSICGECAAILWDRGKPDAAIHLERLCNQLTKRYEIEIFCGFSLGVFLCEEERQVFREICSR